MTNSEKTCFVIGPIGEPGSVIRRDADQLFRHIIEPAATSLGIGRITRADLITNSAIISDDIFGLLNSADVVVADLSGGNPNVYYELAIRHLLRKPFAHLIPSGEALPFDVGTNRAISFDLHDLDAAEEAKNQLVATMRAEMGKSPEAIETPFAVSLAANTARLTHDTSLAELTALVNRLDSRVSVLIQAQIRTTEATGPGFPRLNAASQRDKALRDSRLAARSELPYKAYGSGAPPGSVVEALVSGSSVGVTRVDASGNWVIDIQPSAAANGDLVLFSIDGRVTTSSIVFQPGQFPAPPGIMLA